MTYQSLAIAFAVIGTQAAQLTSLTNTWTAGLAQLEDEKIDAIAEQIGGLSVDEVVAELEGLFAQAEAEAEDSFDDFMDFAQHEADDEAELAQLSAEDTFEDIMDVGLDVAGAAFDIFAQLSADDEEDDYNYASLRYDYFPQLSAEDVDAIADQIGALSVDEVASALEGELEGLFAQLEADVEQWGWHGHFNGDCSRISCSNLSYKCATKDITLDEIMALHECCYIFCGGSSRHPTGH